MISLDELRSRLANPRPGGVVLFTGAGFSDGALNIRNEKIPFARGLSKIICAEMKISDDLPLTLAAELYNESLRDDRAFLNLVRNTFTVKEVLPLHRGITSYPWRRRYTTNYDNLLEFIDPTLKSMNRDQLSFEIEKDPQVIHLNGSVAHLTNNSTIDDFQLTMTQYFDRDLFDTAWASTFRSDLELCDTAVFVGYSMYDPDISKIIFNDPNLKNKTVLVQHDGLPAHEDKWLGRFGTVFKIGNDGLSKILDAVRAEGGPRINQVEPENFSEYLIDAKTSKVGAGPEDIAALLERGIFSRAVFEASRRRESNTYLSGRSAAMEVVDAVKAGAKNILVHSDMGNGKTLIIEMASRDLAGALGKSVYFYNGSSGSLDFDVAAFQGKTEDYILVFDGFFDNQREIEIIRSQLSNATILASERTAPYELRLKEVSSILGSKLTVIDANKLTPPDVKGIVSILDSGAYWSEYNRATNFAAKKRIVEKDCSSEISSLLLGIVKTSVFKAEISARLKELNARSESGELDLICGALMLSFIGMPSQFWLISELLGRDMFTVSKSFSDNRLRHFFSINGREVSARSPMLAQYVLHEIIDDLYLTELMLKMLARSSDRHKRSKTFRTINSRLMQFKNLDRVIKSKKNRHDIVNRFYQRAGDLGYKEFSPPYWSQFAIAARSFNDFKPAERYFKEAQRIALSRNDYYLYKVQNAYAQFLMESRTLTDFWEDYAEIFLEASGIALSQTSLRQAGNYPYKVAGYFVDFAERRCSDIAPRQKNILAQECVRWLDHFKTLSPGKLNDRLVKIAYASVSHTYDVFTE